MDHRWDQALRDERASRAERERLGGARLERDLDVERRDRLRATERRRNLSPWEIGASHWDQRDLYTRNGRVDAGGYARGPALHPEQGSYAYPRADALRRALERREPPSDLHREYERAAWPMAEYDLEAATEPRATERTRRGGRLGGLAAALRALFGRERRRPEVATAEDESIRADVRLALTYRRDLDASEIEVTTEQREVTLRGSVRDRRSKHVAEQVAGSCEGVRRVRNHLRVRTGDGPSTTLGRVVGSFAAPAGAR